MYFKFIFRLDTYRLGCCFGLGNDKRLTYIITENKTEGITAVLSKLEFSGIIVPHQIFVKPKIERIRTFIHLKVAK